MSAVSGFNHVGIITDDLATIRRVFGSVLGVEVGEVTFEPHLGAEFLWVHVGGVALEFIAPVSPDSRPAQLIREGRAGVHHVALTVADADAALQMVRNAGIETIDSVPRAGAHGTRIGFVEPQQVAGTLVELVQPAPANQRTQEEES